MAIANENILSLAFSSGHICVVSVVKAESVHVSLNWRTALEGSKRAWQLIAIAARFLSRDVQVEHENGERPREGIPLS